MRKKLGQIERDQSGHSYSLLKSLYYFCGMAIGHKDPKKPVNDLKSDRAPLSDWATFL